MSFSSSLLSISPVDGRYANKVDALRNSVSEYALQFFRVKVELRWLKHLSETSQISEIPRLSESALLYLSNIETNFSLADGEAIKNIERTTNHDVKAVEYFIKKKFQSQPELHAMSEFVHFACTSEDINNLSYALMLKNAVEKIVFPEIKNVERFIQKLLLSVGGHVC